MRRNVKRTRKMSVVASHTINVFGVIIVLFVMVIINMLASSSCSQLQKAIGERKLTLASLEKDRERESARWDAMRTLDRLEQSLSGLGMNMRYPKAVQIIHMDARGVPLIAQNSVREAQRRQGLVRAASYKADTSLGSVVSGGRPSVAAQARSGRRVRR